MPTLLIETGTTGINHCVKTIQNNEKFLWKEWSSEMIQTGIETIVLYGLNKLRHKPFKIKGKVTKDVINALCQVYDIIEPFSNVIICFCKTNDYNEIGLEILKSIDEKYSTNFTGLTVFEVKSVNKSLENLNGPFSPYTKIEKEIKNIKFKIYYDKSISINIS